MVRCMHANSCGVSCRMYANISADLFCQAILKATISSHTYVCSFCTSQFCFGLASSLRLINYGRHGAEINDLGDRRAPIFHRRVLARHSAHGRRTVARHRMRLRVVEPAVTQIRIWLDLPPTSVRLQVGSLQLVHRHPRAVPYRSAT